MCDRRGVRTARLVESSRNQGFFGTGPTGDRVAVDSSSRGDQHENRLWWHHLGFVRQKGIEIPQDKVMAEIAQAGFEGAPFNSNDSRPPAEMMAAMAAAGLKPAPSYYGARFWVKASRTRSSPRPKRQPSTTQAVGCTELYVAASPLTRVELAGHVKSSDAMPGADFQQFADTLNRVGEISLRYGVKICFHNHVGSVIETREEVDKLFALVDPALVFQGPDLGHLAWAGADVVQFCRDYAKQIVSLHIKDIDPKVMAEGVAAGWNYRTFSDKGIFIELGEGFVDYPAIFKIMKEAKFDKWWWSRPT